MDLNYSPIAKLQEEIGKLQKKTWQLEQDLQHALERIKDLEVKITAVQYETRVNTNRILNIVGM